MGLLIFLLTSQGLPLFLVTYWKYSLPTVTETYDRQIKQGKKTKSRGASCFSIARLSSICCSAHPSIIMCFNSRGSLQFHFITRLYWWAMNYIRIPSHLSFMPSWRCCVILPTLFLFASFHECVFCTSLFKQTLKSVIPRQGTMGQNWICSKDNLMRTNDLFERKLSRNLCIVWIETNNTFNSL